MDWLSTRGNSGKLVANICKLCEQTDVPIHALDEVWVGCGPGQYAGLRISVTVAQSIQLPSRGKVRGICSAHALLMEMHLTYPQAPAIAVCGDARRNHVWLYRWTPETAASAPPDMQCIPIEALADESMPAGCIVASPDYERLYDRLKLPATATWIPGNQTPTVPSIIQLTQSFTDVFTHPQVHYVHPPVTMMPR